VTKDPLPEERVIWRKRFRAEYFDFRGKSLFTRFDGCEFVECTLLIDRDTEQLAFTECVFKDCNIEKLEQDEQRGLYARNNFFDRPLAERRADFEKRLAQALATRKAMEKSDRSTQIRSHQMWLTSKCWLRSYWRSLAGFLPGHNARASSTRSVNSLCGSKR